MKPSQCLLTQHLFQLSTIVSCLFLSLSHAPSEDPSKMKGKTWEAQQTGMYTETPTLGHSEQF